MGKTPGEEAATLAAVGAGLLAILHLANAIWSTSAGVWNLATTALPAAASCGFFVLLRRRPRAGALLALLFAILPQAGAVIASWPARGWVSSAAPALLTLCWAAFLSLLAEGRRLQWLPPLALPLLILTGLQSLGDLLTILANFSELVNGSLGLFWRYNPLLTVWRQLATPAILLLYWISQMRFLLAVRTDE
jgi:hypothetical protein